VARAAAAVAAAAIAVAAVAALQTPPSASRHTHASRTPGGTRETTKIQQSWIARSISIVVPDLFDGKRRQLPLLQRDA
jgi:hypothetical protein